MKAKKVIYMLTALLTMVLLAVCAYAASMDELSYVERFETGKVDIDIRELSVIEEGEDAETQHIVEANKDVSYIPRIINNNADCYIRAKVDVIMDGECQQPLNVDHIYGLGGDWISKGGYFYYTEVLQEGQQTDLFKGIHIPEDWEYGDAEGFSLAVKAEAVQSANFTPDFNSDLPWGSVELKEVETASGADCMEAIPVSVISKAEYTGDGGFQCSTEELFDEFSGMMPGSKYEKTLELKNCAKEMLRVSLDLTADDSELNRRLQLRITADDKEIYSGTAADAGMQESLNIMEIDKKETGYLKLEIGLPADTDNGYMELQDDIVWALDVEEIPDESVQTGDASELLLYIGAALIALVLIIYLAALRREDENETSH